MWVRISGPLLIRELKNLEVENSRKWASHSHLSTFQSSFQFETSTFLLGLQRLDGALMDPMWNDYDKLCHF